MAIAISTGESRTYDGVIYTATSDAVLNLDDDDKVSGLASGSVKAVVSGAETSPTITFDASDGALTFTATSDGEIITVKQLFPIEFISGEFTYVGNKLNIGVGATLIIDGQRGNYSLRNQNTFEQGGTYTFTNTAMTTESQHTISIYTLANGTDTRTLNLEAFGKVINNFTQQGFTLVKGSSEVMHIGDYTLTATAIEDDAGLNIELNENGVTLIPNKNDGKLNVVLTRGDLEIISGDLECTSGSITFGFDKAVTFAEGTSFNFTWNDYVTTVTTTAQATTAIALTDTGISFTPGENDGALNIVITKSGTAIFGGTLNVTGGTISFDTAEQKFSFTEGTKIQLGMGNEELEYEVVGGDASFKVEADTDGNFTITPSTGDGTLNFTLNTSSGSLSGNLEVLSGGFIFGKNGALNVIKDTELQIKFSDDYIINFKATDEAGGSISLSTDGITFTPGSDDGGLQLTVTRDGQTRSASLDVTGGSVTYKLDGSISLTQGTVVKNVFDDDNILTITANTDASGSINFNPQTGLTITPSTPEALNLLLTIDGVDIIKIASVNGSVNYIGGTFTASDGTEIRFVDPAGYYNDNVLRTSGGTTSLHFTTDGITYTANEGATFTMDYLQGTTWELQQGTITNYFSGANQGMLILSEGSIFDTNDNEYAFTLETGNYKLNGMNVTTSAENAKVTLTNYDSIIVDGVSYKALDDAAQLTFGSDGKISGVASGKVQAIVAGAETSPTITFDATDGAIDFTATGDDTLDVTLAGRTFKFTEGTATISGDTINTGAAKFLMSGTHSQADYEFTVEDSSEISITTDYFSISAEKFSVAVSAGSITLNFDVSGTAIRNFINHTFVLADGSTVSTTLGDYTISVTTNDETGGELSFTSKGVTFAPNNNTGLIAVDVLRGGTSIFSKGISFSISNGSISFNPFTQEISLAKDTVLTFVRDDGKSIKITALDEAGGQLTLTDDGIRFAPNPGDGALELNFVSSGRKANLNVTGAIIYGNDGKISLEDGTIVDITWEDGFNLKMTSHGSTGSIAFVEKGLQITTDDDKLDITLTTAIGLQTDLSGIKGTIYYNAGTISFDADSKITATSTLGGQPILTTLETIGGTGHISFADNGVIYSTDTGAMRITWARDDLESTFTINSGTIQIGHNLFKLTEGVDLSTDLKNFVPALYTLTVSGAGSYTINGKTITTDGENISMRATDDYTSFIPSDDVVTYNGRTFSGSGTVTLSSSGEITCDATDGTLRVSIPLEEVIGESILPNTFDISSGSITFDPDNKKISCAAGTTLSFTQNEQTITLTTTKDTSATYKVEDEIYYLMLGDSAAANISIARGDQTIIKGELELGGVVSYRPETGTFGLTGANSSHGDGTNTYFQFTTEGQNGTYSFRTATNDTTIVFIPTLTDGKLEINFPNERKHAMKFTASRDGETIFENNIAIDGKINFDTTTQEVTLIKDTVLTLTQGDNVVTITALDDAGGVLNIVDGGLRFAPNSGDGALELNFVTTGRKANLNVTGAIVLSEGGKISLEDGTEINLDWEDGTNLKLNSHGSTGSVTIGEKGIRITSEDENLDMTLTTPDGYSATITSIQGSLWYNAGTVTLDANTSMTGKNVVEGRTIGIKVEAIDGDASLTFSNVGITYNAGDGKTRVTYTLGDEESSFTLNKGSVFIQRRVFHIAEGSDLATDFKDFIPVQYFQTQEAGTYTINGHTITTTAANLALTATDDYMTFVTSDDVVTYNGMTFAGAGNVSITSGGVVLGAGVVADGFGKDKSFILAETGSVTADARIFELTEEVPTGISVTGTQDGFIFSRTNTEESEARFDKPNPDNVGKIFTEEFSLSNDNAYRIQTDLLGLQQIIGVTAPVTVVGSASFGGEPEETIFDVVTNSEGVFNVDEKPYTISGDSSVAIMADFEPDKSYVRGFKDLNGTVSGDFTEHAFSINGGASILISGDSSIDLVAGANGVELFNVSGGVSLMEMGGVSKVHTDTEGVFNFGNGEDDTLAITVQGDDNVTFEIDDEQFVTGITNIEGDLFFSEADDYFSINGISGIFLCEFSSIGAYSGALYIHDVQDGSEFVTSDEDKIWLQMLGASFALNDNSLTLTNDADGIWLRNKEIVGLGEGASLKVSEAGNYIANETSLKAKADDIIVGLKDSAYIYDPNNPLITKNTPTEEIVQQMTGGDSSVNVTVASGKENVSLKGGDLVVVEDTSAKVNITASRGNDTIVSKGENVSIKLNSTGKTDLFALEGKMTLEGYDAATGTGFGTNYSNIFDAIGDGIDFDKGRLSIDSAVVYLGKNSEIFNFFNATGEMQKVGYASEDESLNLSKQTDDLILFGEKYSSITSGAGSDSIFADAGSYIDAGAGKNYIEIEEERGTNEGAIINIVNGSNTIANFNTGFDDSSDAIENSSKYWDNKFDGTDIIIKTDGGKAVISNVGSGEDFVKFKQSANGYDYKVALAQKNSVIVASDDIANVYRGEKSGVNFTGFEDSLLVNLNEGAEGKAVDENIYFYGINRVTLGGGQNTLISSSQNETLTSSDGSTEFIFAKDSGRDVIKNFNFDNDTISVGNETITAVNVNSSGGVRMEISGSAVLTIDDAQGRIFRINDFAAKVDKNIIYDAEANYFVATAQNASVIVNESAEIWLDGSHGKTFVGDIRTLDASTAEGKTSLAGNALDNTILAGNGDSTLWGGNGGDDLLVGGASKNTFVYTNGNGNDTIAGTREGDMIFLSEVTLEQIANTAVDNNVATVNFKDGGKLTVNDAANCQFILTQGTQYQSYKVSGNQFVNA